MEGSGLPFAKNQNVITSILSSIMFPRYCEKKKDSKTGYYGSTLPNPSSEAPFRGVRLKIFRAPVFPSSLKKAKIFRSIFAPLTRS